MKVGFAELGKKIILSKISWKDLGERKDPKDILERFGRTKKSKRYPRKIWGGREDPKDILERFWGGRSQIDQDL